MAFYERVNRNIALFAEILAFYVYNSRNLFTMVCEVMKMQEFPGGSKNKWSKLWKKKWFFPALYIVLAIFLITGVVLYQQVQHKATEGIDDIAEMPSYNDDMFDEKAESVLQHEEIIKMPVAEDVQAEIVTKFYDYDASEEEQEKGLTLYNSRYYQSTGVNIAADDGESFQVTAALSGKVQEVREDPLLGQIVVLHHGEQISTYYASLNDVQVDVGDEVKQGDTIGQAGKNIFNEESGNHVHFEIRKGEIEVNPEDFFNEPLSKLIDLDTSQLEEAKEKSEEIDEESNEEDAEDLEETPDKEDEDAATETNRDVSFSITV